MGNADKFMRYHAIIRTISLIIIFVLAVIFLIRLAKLS